MDAKKNGAQKNELAINRRNGVRISNSSICMNVATIPDNIQIVTAARYFPGYLKKIIADDRQKQIDILAIQIWIL